MQALLKALKSLGDSAKNRDSRGYEVEEEEEEDAEPDISAVEIVAEEPVEEAMSDEVPADADDMDLSAMMQELGHERAEAANEPEDEFADERDPMAQDARMAELEKKYPDIFREIFG